MREEPALGNYYLAVIAYNASASLITSRDVIRKNLAISKSHDDSE